METLRRLLLGSFAGADELHASAWTEAESATVEATCTCELGGAVLVMRVREQRRTGTFDAVNVFMADRDTDDLLLYGFDDFGYPPDPPARGRFDGDELVLARCTARGESRTTFAATAHGFRWTKQFRPAADQPWQPVFTGTLQRTSAG